MLIQAGHLVEAPLFHVHQHPSTGTGFAQRGPGICEQICDWGLAQVKRGK
jgi:hypothetical protein